MGHKVQSKWVVITNILAGKLSTGPNLAIDFEFVKCITKNKYT